MNTWGEMKKAAGQQRKTAASSAGRKASAAAGSSAAVSNQINNINNNNKNNGNNGGSGGGGGGASPAAFQVLVQQQQPLKRYSMAALLSPDKLLHPGRASELGYADVYPQKRDQIEDVLTEQAAKVGYYDRPSVVNESLFAFDLLHDKLKSTRMPVAAALTAFSSDLLKARPEHQRFAQARMNSSSSSSFRPPTRKMVKDDVRDAWVDDLASGRNLGDLIKAGIPLFKTEKLLDILVQHQVCLPRANWFIKVVGIDEQNVHAQRNRAELNFAVEWTNTLIAYLNGLLNDISSSPTTANTPAAPVANSSTSSSYKKQQANSTTPGPIVPDWTSLDYRRNFILKWNYTTRLMNFQYTECLLDQKKILKWSLDCFKHSNFDQTSFMIQVVTSLVDEYARSRTFLRYLLDSCLTKAKRIMDVCDESPFIRRQFRQLILLIQKIIVTVPDSCVSPDMWTKHQILIITALTSPPPHTLNTHLYTQLAISLESTLRLIAARNTVLIEPPITGNSTLEMQKQVLDSFTSSSDVPKLYSDWAAAHQIFTSMDKLSSAVKSVCDWAIDKQENYTLRPYLAATLLKHFHQPLLVQEALQVFLDRYDIKEGLLYEDYQRIYLLFGELGQSGVFSYHEFLQRLISRGDLEELDWIDEKRRSWFLSLVRELPVYNAKPHHMNQRRVALYGTGGKDQDVEEIALFNKIKDMIRPLFPRLFGTSKEKFDIYNSPQLDPQVVQILRTQLKHFWRVKLTEWMKSEIYSYIIQDVEINQENWKTALTSGCSLLNSRQYTLFMKLFKELGDIKSIIEVSLWLLSKSPERLMLLHIIDSLRDHELESAAMGKGQKVVDALYKKHCDLKKQGSIHVEVLVYLIYLIGVIPQSTGNSVVINKDQLENDLKLTKTSTRLNKSPPLEFVDIRDLTEDPASIAKAISNLSWSYSSNYDAVKNIYMYSLECIKKTTEKDQPSAVRRKMDAVFQVMSEINSRNNFIRQISVSDLLNWVNSLSEHGSSFASKYSVLTNSSSAGSCWMIRWIVSLATHRCCSLVQVFANIFLPLLKKCISSTEIQPDFAALYYNILVVMELLIVSPMSMGGSEEEIMLRLSSQDRHALHSIHKFDLAADTESVHLLLQLAHSISSIRWKIIYNDMSCPVQPHLEKLVVICGRIETAFNQADFWMKRLAVKDPLSLYDKVVQHILNREVRDLSPSIVTSSSSSFASSPLLLLAKRAHSIHFFRLLLSDTSISSTVFLEKDATLSSLDTSAATTITSTPALQTAADLNSFKNALRLYTEQLLDAASFQRYKVAVIMVLEHASIVSQMISSSRGGGGGQEHDAGRMNNNESAEEATSSSASLMEELFEFYGRLLLDSLLAKRAPLDLLQSTIAGIDERVSFQISLHLVVHCKVVMENLLAVVEGSRPWNSRTNDNNNMVDGESLWTEEDCLLWNDEAVTMFCKFVRTCCHFVVTKCTTTSSSSSSSVSSPESKRIRQACLDVVGCITRFFDWIDSNLKIFEVMDRSCTHFSYAKAALETNADAVSAALDWLRQRRSDMTEDSADFTLGRCRLEHVRLAVYLHLQIMVPLVPILVSEAVAFNAVQFIRHLFRLTASKVVHGLDHCPGLFDLVFDLLCWVSDEVGVVTEVKSTLSATQKELQQQLVLPAVYVDRVSRLFHFQPRYALYENLLLVTDLVSTTQVSNTSTAVSGGAVSVGPGTSSGAAALSSSCSNTVTAAVSTSASAAVVGNNTITSSVFTPTASVSNVHQSNVYFKPWELLEDWSDSSSTSTATTVTGGVGGGGNPLVSNTPLSLSLFGAVRVPTSFDVVNGQCNSSYRDLLGSSGWRPLKIVAETGVVPQQASATLSSKGSPIKTPFSPMAVDTPQATTQQIEMHLVASATSSNSLKRARE